MSDFVRQPILKQLNRRNPISRIETLESSVSPAPSATVNTLGELAEDIGNAGVGATLTRSDGYYKVLRLSYVEHSSGTFFTSDLPAGTLSDDNILEFEVTGLSLNITGGALNMRVRTIMDGASTLVSSDTLTSIASSASYRPWVYRVRLQQAACLGNFVQCDEELRVDGVTPMIKTTTTQLLSSISDENNIYFQLGWSGATSYVNIRVIYNTWSLKIIDGISDTQKRFWTQPTGTRGYDARIQSANPTTNHGNDMRISVGESNATVNTWRTLIKFSDLNNIPSNAVIDQAFLWVTVEGDLSSNARVFSAYRVLRAWTAGNGTAGSGATWNTYDGTNAWSTAGCGNSTLDYDGSVALATCSFGAAEPVGSMKAFSFNTTELQKFVDGTYTNNGFLLKAATETDDLYNLHSADTATPTLAPVLEVLYHLP